MSTAPRTDFDTELQRYNEVLRQVCNIQSSDTILDIGCGTGQTTMQAARAARAGSAFGVDVSASSIEQARQLAAAADVQNVTFECADAQTYDFPQEHFDVAISRFGTMFFHDPPVAFARIRQALRPDGRLIMMVWQASERNEWIVAINHALNEASVPLPKSPNELNPFSLADPVAVTDLLETVGFSNITFTNVREPVFYGKDVAAAFDWIHGFTCTSRALQQSDPATAERTVKDLREMLAAHMRENGIWFDSRAWIITAHCR